MPDYNALNPACSGDMMLLIQAIQAGVYPWWYPNNAKSLAIDHFIYGADVLPLPASLSDTASITIDGSSAFVICSSQMVVTLADNTTFLAGRPIKASFLDTGSGRQLSNIAVQVDNNFGTAEHPFVWPVPKIIAPNSTLQITLQNLSAQDLNVSIAYAGFKIFNFRPGD
ncbi:MAG TPA: hypothetical protein VH374_26260 [Polyangia bacterium]|jgi:hypothetical protein|nr:hypothetical protein [Polyangia bacterium]